MHEEYEDKQYFHYTTPVWVHLLAFGVVVGIAVLICEVCHSIG
ncbi:hypothetical protein [Phyllobacterium sp. P30BS-XVII]|nr:hypothetical protein [Phyllobacterium sp. P30BS-XVII]MBA8900253.1 hypothetical protein [Phyllobacterium sp. P30BS-XVII]